jgi:hypothetical protein
LMDHGGWDPVGMPAARAEAGKTLRAASTKTGAGASLVGHAA